MMAVTSKLYTFTFLQSDQTITEAEYSWQLEDFINGFTVPKNEVPIYTTLPPR